MSPTLFEQPKCLQARHLWVTSSSQRLCALPCLHSPVPLSEKEFLPAPSWALYPLPLCSFGELALGARQRTGATANRVAPWASLSDGCSPVNHGGLCTLRAHAPECQTREASVLLPCRDGKSLSSGIQGEKEKQAQNSPAWRRALAPLRDTHCVGMDCPSWTAQAATHILGSAFLSTPVARCQARPLPP